MNQYRRGLMTLSLATCLGMPLAAVEQAGVASTRGTMEVNNLSVRGTANIPNGASVLTKDAPGQIRMQNGVQVALSEKTAATVYSDHVQLLKGAVQVAGAHSYGVDALGFHIESAADNVSARVAYDQGRILVTAMQSPVNVSKGGTLVSQVKSGTTFYFEPDPAAGVSASGKAQSASRYTTGISTGAKWGIAAGAAGAGTAAALVGSQMGNSKSSGVSR